MNLRDATPADLPAIVAIYNSIIPGRMVTADLEPVTVESRTAWFAAHSPASRPIWVLENEAGDVIAWLSFDTFYARAAYDATVMVAVYVAESLRGKGIGSMLLERALEHAPKLGIRNILGYIFAHNEPSLRLFKKLGFQRWAHLPGVAQLDGIERDLVIVGKRLSV
jgi:phosphinothricin acetyltransferase